MDADVSRVGEVVRVGELGPRIVASPARVTDVLLGGKDNYAADRDLAAALLAVLPQLDAGARESRAFLRRTVGTLAERGMRQFLDIGCGLPGAGNVHEAAVRHDPGVRVVYADNDPLVLAHARALLARDGGVAAVQYDLRDPGGPVGPLGGPGLIDWDRPVAVLLGSVLQFLDTADGPYEAVARLREAMAPGSALVISHLTGDFAPDEVAEAARIYAADCTAPLVPRSHAEIAPFFGELEPVAPGLAPLAPWRRNGGRARAPSPAVMYAGVGVRTP
ncbi:SAM-dependent methyltransferase [Actinomadura rugatobispora]|uniref:SAM-dependent methyltransferase n=1 Tax=Actinomadura rugatobispora TaxID=1994 RepID=A0ABW1A3A7_9ACTN|nr:SAM-dependent methyltransferase [Actinomadura rugatobispora]